MFFVPANICRDVGLLEATLYQITLSEVTRQTGVSRTGQAGPSAISSAMWPKGQSQISFWLPQSALCFQHLSPSLKLPRCPQITLILFFSLPCPREFYGF